MKRNSKKRETYGFKGNVDTEAIVATRIEDGIFVIDSVEAKREVANVIVR